MATAAAQATAIACETTAITGEATAIQAEVTKNHAARQEQNRKIFTAAVIFGKLRNG
jgi:hypothetical protein